jgi:S1-C subfamily serine protease
MGTKFEIEFRIKRMDTAMTSIPTWVLWSAVAALIFPIFATAVLSQTPQQRSSPKSDRSLAAMIDKVRSSVVRIQDSQGSGTGFFINGDGLVVTANHVISNDLNRPCLEL